MTHNDKTQDDVAELIGVSQATVSTWLGDRAPTGAESLVKLERECGVQVRWWTERLAPPRKPGKHGRAA